MDLPELKEKDTINYIEYLFDSKKESDRFIERLRSKGFFTVPASIKYHEKAQGTGGLAKHSTYVTYWALSICKAYGFNIENKSHKRKIIKCCILHDLNKCLSYKKSRSIKKTEIVSSWSFEPTVIGDGDLSTYLIRDLGLTLTVDEYYAVRYHNVFDDNYQKNLKFFSRNKVDLKLLLLVQHADQLLTHIGI